MSGGSLTDCKLFLIMGLALHVCAAEIHPDAIPLVREGYFPKSRGVCSICRETCYHDRLLKCCSCTFQAHIHCLSAPPKDDFNYQVCRHNPKQITSIGDLDLSQYEVADL